MLLMMPVVSFYFVIFIRHTLKAVLEEVRDL